jgi:hypothetical protein
MVVKTGCPPAALPAHGPRIAGSPDAIERREKEGKLTIMKDRRVRELYPIFT